MKNITLLLLLFSVFTFSQTTPGEYEVNNLDSNTKNSDFGTTFYGNDKIIFSSASRQKKILKNNWNNKQPFLDLYEASINTDGTVSNVKEFSNKLNTRFHEASISFTPDQKTVFFTRNNYFKNKLGKDTEGMTNIALYKATVAPDGGWTDVKSLPFNNVKYSVGSPAVSKDGKKLYFASDMPGTNGLTDIYVVDLLGENSYGIPKNLGKKINTSGSENFPYIDDDNVLYFSSDSQKGGLGGLDVYAAKIYDDSISDILHLGHPVNSNADDFAYILKNGDTQNEGYFSSNRSGGKGDDDIYHFKSSPPLKIECNQTVVGTIKDKKTNALIAGAVVVIFDGDDNEIDTATTNKTGSYKFSITCENDYKVKASKEEYKSDEKTFTTTLDPDVKITHNLVLDPIIPVVIPVVIPEPEVVVVRQRVVVNIQPIYFDLDKSNIRQDARIELDKVVEIMQKHSNLMIEGGSHTDSRGDSKYNESLSSRRANSTVAYIVSKGIDASRITARGYGETRIINQCIDGTKCTEYDHQQNRRTEFVILNPDVLGFY
ncbi:MAG: OmpA family protein [Flavobacteriaceae bacterium]